MLSFKLLSCNFLKCKVDKTQIGKKNKHQHISATVPPLPWLVAGKGITGKNIQTKKTPCNIKSNFNALSILFLGFNVSPTKKVEIASNPYPKRSILNSQLPDEEKEKACKIFSSTDLYRTVVIWVKYTMLISVE